MNAFKLFACGLLGVLFAMLENYLFDAGILLDSVLASISGATITDLMIITFIGWLILGLFLSSD